MHVVTSEQMRRAEEAVFALGVSEAALMESAGRHVADVMWQLAGPQAKVAIVCGAGHNGGDGLVAARYLANRGLRVMLVLTRPVERLSPLLQGFFAPLPEMGVRSVGLDEAVAEGLLHTADWIIDALLGTGSSGPPRGAVREAVEAIVRAERPVLAVDVPTGVEADTGTVHIPCIKARATVAMAVPKVGHLVGPGAAYCGRLYVVDVGIPKAFLEREARAVWVRPEEAASLFPPRPADSHKGLFGKLVIIAGSYTMPGAAVLAVQAGLRSGVGLCSWAGPEVLRSTLAVATPEATLFPLPGDDKTVTEDAVESALEVAEGRAVALGPGIGLTERTERFVAEFLSKVRGPVVVDADGLTHLARLGRWPGPDGAQAILTPHPKEMARLLGAELGDVLGDPMGAAREGARRYGAVVLLKGVPTVVSDPDGCVRICRVGNPVLSVGGSGDVLTGLVAGLAAQGLACAESATLGVLWHGTAADLLAAGGQDAAHTAGELIRMLARARAQLLAGVK